MPSITTLLAFGLVAFGLAATPGPNMIYLVSRSLSQGPRAGLVSLIGVGIGFIIFMLLAAFGITAVFVAVPYAYDGLRLAGAGYLLYLAWQALKPGGRSPFQVRELPADSPRKLVLMGLMTNLLNPKAAMLYLALLPQFVDPARGSVLLQSVFLGSLQIVISMAVNGVIAATAGSISSFLARSPRWLMLQRWFMGTVLAALAVNMLRESRR
jgi:threonine/homoserine/homoserine lactone efflux protein